MTIETAAHLETIRTLLEQIDEPSLEAEAARTLHPEDRLARDRRTAAAIALYAKRELTLRCLPAHARHAIRQSLPIPS